jgi:ankyrin repeat protein
VGLVAAACFAGWLIYPNSQPRSTANGAGTHPNVRPSTGNGSAPRPYPATPSLDEGLVYAISHEDLDTVDQLIRQGANIRKCEYCKPPFNKATILGIAVSNNSKSDAIVRRLLAAGAPIEEVNHVGYTPLLQAAEWGNPVMIRALLAAGANIEARVGSGANLLRGATPLFLAVTHLEAAQALVAAGAKVNAHSDMNETPLSFAIFVGAPVNVVKFLIQHGADVNNISKCVLNDCGSTTVLMMAVHGKTANSPEIVRLLLSSGADPGALDEHGRTALMRAHEEGNDGMYRVLKDFQDRKHN